MAKRKRFLVSAFQYRLIGFNLAYALTVVLTFAALTVVPLMIEMQKDMLPLNEKFYVLTQVLSLHLQTWPLMLLALLGLTAHSIFVSHKIAGPLVRFRSVFQSVAGGDLSIRTSIRKGDYLREESDALGGMVQSLNTWTLDAAQKCARVRAQLERVQGLHDVSDEMAGLLRSMQQEVVEFEVHLSHFKTVPPPDGVVHAKDPDANNSAGHPSQTHAVLAGHEPE